MNKIATRVIIFTGFAIFTFTANASAAVLPFAEVILANTPPAGVSIPTDLLGAPDGALAQFDNVGGTPGSVTVGFNSSLTIIDGAGDDFKIYLGDFTVVENELFETFISNNGIDFVSLGVTAPTTVVDELPEMVSFDLFGSGLSEARQIRILNSTVVDAHAFEGPDLDAIEALNFNIARSTAIPEPATLLLVASGLLGLATRRKKNY